MTIKSFLVTSSPSCGRRCPWVYKRVIWYGSWCRHIFLIIVWGVFTAVSEDRIKTARHVFSDSPDQVELVPTPFFFKIQCSWLKFNFSKWFRTEWVQHKRTETSLQVSFVKQYFLCFVCWIAHVVGKWSCTNDLDRSTMTMTREGFTTSVKTEFIADCSAAVKFTEDSYLFIILCSK